jgi:hypothetical protein
MNYNALNSELELAAPLSLYQRFLAVAGGFNSANRSSASVKRHDGDARSTFEIIGDLMGYSVALQNDLQFHSKRLKQAYKKKRNVYLLCFALLWLPFVLATIKLLDFIVTLLAAFKSIHMEQWSGITRLALFILVFVITFCITFFLSWVLKKLLGQKGDKLKPGLFGLIVASMAIYVIYMFVEVAQPFTTSLGMEPWSPLAIA